MGRSRSRGLAASWRLACVGVILGAPGCGGKRVASVNGKIITQDQFVAQMERSYGLKVLQWMITYEMVADGLKRQGITITPEEVAKEVKEWRQSQGLDSPQAFQSYLRANGTTEKYVEQDLRLILGVEKLATQGVVVTDADVKKYFDNHKGKLGAPATVVLQDIAVKTKEEAAALREKIVNGANFTDLAREKSIDPAAKQTGGNLGRQALRDIYPIQLRQAIERLDVGQISEPLHTSFGYHIIKVLQKSAAEPARYDQVKEAIRRQLKRDKGKRQEDLIKELAAKSTIKVFTPQLSALEEAFGRPGGERGAGGSATLPGPPAKAKSSKAPPSEGAAKAKASTAKSGSKAPQ